MFGVALLGGIAFVAWPRHEAVVGCDGTPFSRSAWSSGGDAQTDEGYQLAACERLIGMTGPQLERLLGAPVERDAEGLAWEMGPDGLGIDSMFLYVVIEGGRVASASVAQG
ncbi:hypothetical protein OJ998_22815 [Solirubrobacter taibaiensis]|nr:hypothetical protein [Solirubrobacter taibaiensis]